MTRETVRDPPQYHVMRLSGNGAGPQLRQLSDYPHPYPSLRELQKEVIRCPSADLQLFIFLSIRSLRTPCHATLRKCSLPQASC